MGRTMQRRSIVMMIPKDEKTADEITEGVVGFIKTNYKIPSEQIEVHKRAVFVNRYVEVDAK